jgi:S1-C subfamily serine protease
MGDDKKMFDEEKTIKAVEKVSPSVVSVSTKRLMRYDLFNTFGYVLTNNHVIEGARTVDVYLNDGKKYEGTVVGTDPDTDIAIIKIDGHNFYSGEFGNSDDIKTGQMVIAIGNSLGLSGGPTVTVGVISAVRRNIPSKQGILENMIQTDAAINPGNSGGPLIDSDGRIIAINNAIIPYAQGIGFAIPINVAKDVANELISYGRVTRPWLGILGMDMNPTLASYYNLASDEGALIVRINEDSPAYHAGLQPGDIIVKIGENPVKGMEDLRHSIWQRKTKEKVKIQILRKHQQLTGTLQLTETSAS